MCFTKDDAGNLNNYSFPKWTRVWTFEDHSKSAPCVTKLEHILNSLKLLSLAYRAEFVLYAQYDQNNQLE